LYSFKVVDPSIRLSWVAKHWDPDDAKKTRETVIALVSKMIHSFAMLKYALDGGISSKAPSNTF
jgi:hypothetical protein